MHIFEKGKVSLKEATIDFFKGIFNYLGVTTRRGFGWGILVGGLCLFPVILLSSTIYENSKFTLFSGLLVTIFILLYSIAYLAIYFRRMRDIGFKARTTLLILLLEIILFFITNPILMIILKIAMFFMALLVPTGQFKTQSESGFVHFMMVKKGEIK